jgi:hypothetical protein
MIKQLYYYVMAHIILLFQYDKKYLKSSLFSGRFGGVTADGWKIIVKSYFGCKKLGVNTDVPFPVSPRAKVSGAKNISFDPEDLQIFQSHGCYYQGYGEITIGKGTFVAPNVGMITANHDFANLKEHAEAKPIHIGKECWIGMNAVILPGVTLGDHTIVGAGSVVTKSFENGNCVIAGNPAKIIKNLEGASEEEQNG